ncbi:ABC transporter ATP-binding protein [Helcococcus ovis]|uniref:ABC transporter ATP-binding protein n=1 Tax=Helcococcus ovis TaxID=72026 RepID=UPI00106F8352|nr:ABC transporter ATP-binding protein [Helcococcus ovis]TFF67991.1 ABC transporter ATP-binding protein [Helcococcus ovis]WNZ01146.1 ABC transporter ATP-binding protein [Helcococcus ovis]
MINIKNVSKEYISDGGIKINALSNISFNFEKGKFYSITGPSGSGKSTLLNIIALLLPFEKGEYFIDEINIKNFNDKKSSLFRNSFFGFVVQDYELLDSESAIFNIQLPSYIGKKSRAYINERSKKILDFLNIKDIKDKKVMNLSGGQKQRVAIARALMNSPKVILADEPTGALDYDNGLQVMNIFKDIVKNEGVTVIMVTHNQEFAKLADQMLTIKDGRLYTR